MASVRMTNMLRNDILRAACDAFDIANPDLDLSNEDHRLFREAILAMPVQEHLRQFARTGYKSFNFSAPNEKDVTAIDVHPEGDADSVLGRRYKTVHLQTPMKIYTTVYSNPDVYIQDMKPEHRAPVQRMIMDLHDRQREHNDKRHKYRTSIKQLLEQCSSVKQFLDAWPAGEQFVPVEAKQRMQQKITRQQRAQQIREEVNFDASDVNEVVLTAKVMGL